MNSMGRLVLGIAAVFGSAWAAMALYPHALLATLQPEVSEEGPLPQPIPGNASAGRRVYQANGCVYCHSQQVRPSPFAGDIARGWGVRQTVARDFLRDDPAFLGMVRNGPDLANIGLRRKEAGWYFRLLYEPDMLTEGSAMPSYRYLFEERKIQGQRSALAVDVRGHYAPRAGYEIVPKPEAVELVAYLMALKRSDSLPEAPVESEKPSPFQK